MAASRRVSASLRTIARVALARGSAACARRSRGVVPSLVGRRAERSTACRSRLRAEGSIKERADSRFTEIVRAEQGKARIGMGLLATIGSTSPFVGLFGTVWGIMNSLHRDLEGADHQPRRRRARHRRSAAGNRDRPRRRDPGGDLLQSLRARRRRATSRSSTARSGAVSRLLSRDLDRGGSVMSRAAE